MSTESVRLARIAEATESMSNQMTSLLTHVSTLVEHLMQPRYLAQLQEDGSTLVKRLDDAAPEQMYLFRRPNDAGLACACLTRREWEEYQERGCQLVLTYAQPVDFDEAASLHREIAAFFAAMVVTPAEAAKEDGTGPHTVIFFQHDSFGAHSFLAHPMSNQAVTTVKDVETLWEERRAAHEYPITLVAAYWGSPEGVRVWDVQSGKVYEDEEAVRQWRNCSATVMVHEHHAVVPVGFIPQGDRCHHCRMSFSTRACGLGHAMMRRELSQLENGAVSYPHRVEQ
jgi:hypothetical protein